MILFCMNTGFIGSSLIFEIKWEMLQLFEMFFTE